MRNRLTRILLFAFSVLLLGFLFNQYFVHFSGDGKDTALEALPTDAEYEWIEGPRTEKEQRYFFLSNGNYFGTGLVTKNLKGWSSSDGAYAKLPAPLEVNKITAAYSDNKVLFGLIKPLGNVKVIVNGKEAELISIATVSEKVIELYNVKGYSFWYIELDELDEKKKFTIQVFDEKDTMVSELKI